MFPYRHACAFSTHAPSHPRLAAYPPQCAALLLAFELPMLFRCLSALPRCMHAGSPPSPMLISHSPDFEPSPPPPCAADGASQCYGILAYATTKGQARHVSPYVDERCMSTHADVLGPCEGTHEITTPSLTLSVHAFIASLFACFHTWPPRAAVTPFLSTMTPSFTPLSIPPCNDPLFVPPPPAATPCSLSCERQGSLC